MMSSPLMYSVKYCKINRKINKENCFFQESEYNNTKLYVYLTNEHKSIKLKDLIP